MIIRGNPDRWQVCNLYAIFCANKGWDSVDFGKIFDRFVAVCALIFTAVGATYAGLAFYAPPVSAPSIAPTIPVAHGASVTPTWALLLITTGLILAIISIVRLFSVKKERPPAPIATSVRLQFQPNGIIPVNLDAKNIKYWYALRNAAQINEGPSANFPQGRQVEFRYWIIFLIFERAVAFRQILVNSNGVGLPEAEVKDRGTHHAIVIIGRDIAAETIEISALL